LSANSLSYRIVSHRIDMSSEVKIASDAVQFPAIPQSILQLSPVNGAQ